MFCLLTSLSDLKKIGVFTSKIVFHLSNLRRIRRRINLNNGGRCGRSSHVRPSFFYYCIYALGFHPTKEPISAKAKVAHNQRQEKKNEGVFFAFAKEDLPQKKSRMGSRKTTILVRTYASKPIRRVINRSRRVIERKIIHLRRKKNYAVVTEV